MRGRAGFTLIELVVVVLIVAVAASTAVPALGRRDRGGAAAARDLAAVYTHARVTAVSRATPATVTLDAATGRYAVVMRSGVTGAADTVRTGRLPRGVDIWIDSPRRERAVAVFGPLGRAHARPTTLADREGRRVVIVDPWTGAVDVRNR